MSNQDYEQQDLIPRPGPRAQLYADDGGDDHYEDEPPRRRGLTSALVVVLGLGVFGGIIWYAYSQGTRAGSETVAPVLRADGQPTKVRPDQPGGLQVPHQDKLVYGRLNPGAATEPGVERLLPPPEVPVDRPKAPEPVQPAPQAQTAAPTQAAPPAPASVAPPVETAKVVPPKVEAPKPEPVKPTAPPPQALSAQAPAAQTAPAQVAPPPAVAAAPAVQPAAPSAAGSVRLQIAAVDSEAKAASEWSRLQKRFPAELGPLGVRYVRADLGAKGVFFRIQAGPVDEGRARDVCAVLKAQNVGCIPVKN